MSLDSDPVLLHSADHDGSVEWAALAMAFSIMGDLSFRTRFGFGESSYNFISLLSRRNNQ